MKSQGLLLLLLLGGDCATCFLDFQIWQPCQLTARAKGSVTLPCTFNYTWEATETAEVYWRLGGFHVKLFAFNFTHSATQKPTHPNYTGRVSLVGDLRGLDASIRIENLQESDSNFYFCRVSVQTRGDGVQKWQTFKGTNLTVTGTPLEDNSSTFKLIGLVTGAVLAAVVVLGLLIIAWRKGCCSKAFQGRRASPPSKEKPVGREYEDLRLEDPKAPPPASSLQPPARAPPPAPTDSGGGLLYADLNLAGGRGKKQPSRGRGEETTYAILRH